MGRNQEPGRATGRQLAATLGTDAKRERIMAIAARLFFEHGYANTTIAAIARELGVTKPFVYYYFGDKLELFEAICWRPTLACLSGMAFDPADPRSARDRLADGLAALVRTTVAHYPAATLPYREPQVFSARYQAEMKRLANGFHARLTALLEQARQEGSADVDDARITARAVASIPGFLHTWYRPGGRLDEDEIVARLTRLCCRTAGLYA